MILRYLCGIGLTLVLMACGGGGGGGSTAAAPVIPSTPGAIPPYEYSPPEDIQDGWPVSKLEDQQLDTDRITRTVDRMVQGELEGIDAIAIARRGELVLVERFARELDQFDQWIGNRDPERHVLHSASKSFTSALIGIAIDQGYFGGTEVPYLQVFDYASYDNNDPRKANITLEDVLTMRLGIEWDEWSEPYTSNRNDLVALTQQYQDWTKALLDRPMAAQPGTVYAYNTAATNSLCDALSQVTGMSTDEFSARFLFEPLQMSSALWDNTPTGHCVGGSGLFLTARDMAKFGQLFLDDGQWQGQQIISADWVERSVTRAVDFSGQYTSGYGYQWWLGEFREGSRRYPFYFANGYGGQNLVVIEELELVVAIFAQNYENNLHWLPQQIIERDIIPAVLDR
jgi:CubicO group peptidase (beta-lactamase class C family)